LFMDVLLLSCFLFVICLCFVLRFSPFCVCSQGVC
jgi:hypothetical protein